MLDMAMKVVEINWDLDVKTLIELSNAAEDLRWSSQTEGIESTS